MATAREIARFLYALPGKFEREIKRAENKTLTAMYREARKASSGKHSLADLAKAGHPFAVRDPQTENYPPQYINKQTGEFLRGWVRMRAITTGGRVVIRLINTDPKKEFLEGTDLMVQRPLGPYVLRITRAIRRKNLRDALRKVRPPK